MSLFEKLSAELKGSNPCKAFKIQGIAYDNYIVGNLTDDEYRTLYFNPEFIMNRGI